MSSSIHDLRVAEFPRRLAESARFHMGIGNVHQAVRDLARDLDSAGIDYAIIGAMALNPTDSRGKQPMSTS